MDKYMIPLKSALMIWASVEKENDQVYRKIQNWIKIQATAVYMGNDGYKEEEEIFARIFGCPNSLMTL